MLKKPIPMIDILNLALPYFGLDFHRLRLRQGQALPEDRAGMDELLLALCVAAGAALWIMAKTPFAELNNPPFLIATTLGTRAPSSSPWWRGG